MLDNLTLVATPTCMNVSRYQGFWTQERFPGLTILGQL